MSASFRYLKWVGEPPVVQADGFRIHNWKYENRRRIALEMPHGTSGRMYRIIEAGTYRDRDGVSIPVKREYIWDQDKHEHFVVPVELDDAMAIMRLCPNEFIDVTDKDKGEWAMVRNQPIVVGKSPSPAHQGGMAQ